jgi:broad specificity phosphatase PhoE
VTATILLARHGETDWNRSLRWQGHADPPLNATGCAQARALAASLAGEPLAAVYSSDLRRAYETARIVADGRGLRVVATPALREINVGSWEGMTWDEIQRRFPEGYLRHLTFDEVGWEHGETHEQMAERVLTELDAIAAAHDGEQVLVVVHGGPIRAVVARALSVPQSEYRRRRVPVENASVVRLSVGGGEVRALEAAA